MEQITGGITAVPGVLAAGINCGIKSQNKDLALIFCRQPATVAAMFTTNEVKAAPIQLCQQKFAVGFAQAVIINSGNANAGTGDQGMADCRKMAETTAQGLNISDDMVWVASTGIIGVPMPMDKITAGIRRIIPQLSSQGGEAAAEAIITTDTHPKQLAVSLPLSAGKVTMGGMVKGAGMIRPKMATMLCFLTTDAKVEQSHLQSALQRAVEGSFNLISIDGDTSTNDMIMMMATGEGPSLEPGSRDWAGFEEGLRYITRELAYQLILDAEGATKLIRIQVTGAKSREQARKVAFAIADSNLVKCAFFGQHLNWGRILAAAGYAGAGVDPKCLDIYIGGIKLVEGGARFAAADEAAAQAGLACREITLRVDLGLGDSAIEVLTCDFSLEYVKINAHYQT